MSEFGYEELDDDELAAEEERLAELRTDTRLRQNEVSGIRSTRAALASLPDNARRLIPVELGGTLAPSGAREEA